MNSTEANTDIFFHSPQNKNITDNSFIVSSSLFTTSTPNKQIVNDVSDTSYINNRLMNIHNKIMDTEFLPISNTDIESASVQSGGQASTTQTRALPINYSESTLSDSSQDFEYGIGEIEDETESSSESSSPTNSSEDSDEPVKRKKYILKKTNSRSSSRTSANKQPAKKKSRKGSKKAPNKAPKKPAKKTSKKPVKKTSRKTSNQQAKKTSRKKSKSNK